MRAIVPRHVAETAQAEVRFVCQSRRLQRVTGTLHAEMTRRDRSQLGVDQWQEALEGAVITLLPRAQIRCDPVVVDRAIIQGRPDPKRARGCR
jgi:hypothetical protein